MTVQTDAASDQTSLSVWRREYRASLALVSAGIVLIVAISAFSLWANSTGNYPTSVWSVLAIDATETAGAALIFFGGTVAYYHRLGLRQSRRIT